MHQPRRPVTARGQFIRLLDQQGPPPQVIWLRLGDCSKGKGAAGACVSPRARRGGWGSAGVVLAPAMAPPRSADSACVVVVSLGFQPPSAPDETCTWFWGRLRPSPGGAV
jgi:hypothetical protein